MKKFLIATAMSTILTLSVLSPAHALIVKSEDLPDGGHVESVYDDDGNYLSAHFYDENNKHVLSIYNDSNPGDGDGGASSPDEIMEAIEDALRKGGGTAYLGVDFFDTPFGKMLIEKGQVGSIVPHHNPSDAFGYGDDGGQGGGAGGFDPNGGGIKEQIKANAGKSNDDDDDNGATPDPAAADNSYLLGNPELVNPVPFHRQQATKAPTPQIAIRRIAR